MNDLILQYTLAAAGIACFWVCRLGYRRNWKWPTFWLAAVGAGALALAQPWFQGFVKAGLLAAIVEHGNRLNRFSEAMEAQKRLIEDQSEQLKTQQKEITAHQSELNQLQSQLKEAQKSMSARAESLAREVTDVQAVIGQAKTDLAHQQRDVSDVKHLVKGLLSATRTEIFREVDNKRFLVLPRENGAAVAIILEHVPYPDSVRVQFHVYAQPSKAYKISGNVLLLNWGGSIHDLKSESLKTRPFYVEYISDLGRDAEINEVVRYDGDSFELKFGLGELVSPRDSPR